MTHDVFNAQVHVFRFYADGTESGSSPYGGAAENANVNVDVSSGNVQIHLRVGIQENGAGSASGAATDDWGVQCTSSVAGAFTVTGSSTRVKADTGSSLTDGAATTNRATNGISDGAGTFVAGEQEETNGVIEDHQLTADNFTEHVYAFLVVAADVANAETLDFAITLNGSTTASITNSVTPRITITKTVDTSDVDSLAANTHLGQFWMPQARIMMVPSGMRMMARETETSGYYANAWTFDGTNDWIEKSTIAASDLNICLVSLWFRVNTLSRAQYLWGGYNNFRCYIRLSSGNVIQIRIGGNAAVNLWTSDVNSATISDNNWHHICMSWDSSTFTTTDKLTIRLDGVAKTLASAASASGATDLNLYYFVGAEGGSPLPPVSSTRFDGDIAEFFFHAGFSTYFDLDTAGNIEKFRTTGGKPENLGSDGSTPLGEQPLQYLNDPASTANVNKGSAGNWTIGGALGVATSSPSD